MEISKVTIVHKTIPCKVVLRGQKKVYKPTNISNEFLRETRALVDPEENPTKPISKQIVDLAKEVADFNQKQIAIALDAFKVGQEFSLTQKYLEQ